MTRLLFNSSRSIIETPMGPSRLGHNVTCAATSVRGESVPNRDIITVGEFYEKAADGQIIFTLDNRTGARRPR